MPRSRRVGKQRMVNWEKFRTYLSFGFDFFGDLNTDNPPEEDVKRAWEILRESILQEFAENKNRSGQRPWAYWVLDQGMDGRPEQEEQARWLRERGLLTQEEEKELAERAAHRAALRDETLQ